MLLFVLLSWFGVACANPDNVTIVRCATLPYEISHLVPRPYDWVVSIPDCFGKAFGTIQFDMSATGGSYTGMAISFGDYVVNYNDAQSDTKSFTLQYEWIDPTPSVKLRRKNSKLVDYPWSGWRLEDGIKVRFWDMSSGTSSETVSLTITPSFNASLFPPKPPHIGCDAGSCGHHGSCNTFLDRCTCEPGWQGTSCEFPTHGLKCVSEDGRCFNDGNCWLEDDNCLCGDYYFGSQCELPKTDVLDLVTCDDSTQTKYCSWTLQYYESYCMKEYPYCFCENDQSGSFCEFPREEDCTVSNGICEHGICNLGSGGCICMDGWYGAKCNFSKAWGFPCLPKEKDVSDSSSCANGGVCLRGPNRCYCQEGFSGNLCGLKTHGFLCEIDQDCGSDYQHGICEQTVGLCRCAKDWYGIKCEQYIGTDPILQKEYQE